MVRKVSTQPMVKDANALAIGLMKVCANEVNVDTQFLVNESTGADSTVSADTQTAPTGGSPDMTQETLGALQEAGLTATPTFKEHQSGYPKATDAKVLEETSATLSVTMEEIASAKGMYMLRKILDTLNTGTPHYFSSLARAQYATGDVRDFWMPVTVLKPELNISVGNDWGGIPLTFEAVYNSNFSNVDSLIYWSTLDLASRSTDYQPVTVNPDDLVIGKMQFRVGPFATRDAGTAVIYDSRKVVGAAETSVSITKNAGASYTGSVDGAYIFTIVTGGGLGTATYTVVEPDGSTISETATPAAGSNTGIAIGADGLLVDFADVNYTAGDVYVIGVATGSAVTGNSTGILSEYPYLPVTSSIGAVASTEITSDITYKDHTSGYPSQLTLSMVESASIQASASIEEINLTNRTGFTSGKATNLADAAFDSAISGNLYYAPVEILLTTLSGKVVSFWIPNAQLVPNIDFKPGDDWANLPLAFSAQRSGASSVTMMSVHSFDM